jgi:hypothetical protein
MKKILSFLISTILISSGILIPALANASFDVSLGVGSKNTAEVLNLQNFLYSNGYLKVQPTGAYLSLTQKAVTDFQRAEGVSPLSGYFGPLTREAANKKSAVASLPKVSVTAQSVSGDSNPTAIGFASVVQSGVKTVKWQTSNYPLDAGVNINLLKKISDSPKSFVLVRPLAKDIVNDGEESWTPTFSENSSDIYIEVTCSNTYKFKTGCQFGSDPIKVN